jgi:exo-beta-1,3-glucanase (GH17 family)
LRIPPGTAQIQTLLATSGATPDTDGWKLFVNKFNGGGPGTIGFESGDGTAYSGRQVFSADGTFDFSDTGFHSIVLVLDKAASPQVRVTYDGQLVASGPAADFPEGPVDIYIGAMADGNWHMRGMIDEIVIAPEPATIGLLSLGAVACLVRRRRWNYTPSGKNTTTQRLIRRPMILLMLVAISVAMTGRSAQAEPVLFGLGFSPYVDGQGPGTAVTASQIDQRLSPVADYTRYIRDWGSRNGLEFIPDVAAGYEIGVAQCAYLDQNATDNEAEKANLVAAAIRGNVRWAIVGNEALVNGKASEAQLITHLDDVRGALDQAGLAHIPVTTAEPYGSWANTHGGLFQRDASGNLVHAAVLRQLDVLFVNIYPFHEGSSIDSAAGKLSAMYAEVVAAVNEIVPDLPVIIGETGWPSAGLVNISAVPSLSNEERYFRDVTAWADSTDVPVFWFEGFDENWKADGYAEVEKHWGLHYANGEPKFAIPEPGSLGLLLGAGLLALIRRRSARLGLHGGIAGNPLNGQAVTSEPPEIERPIIRHSTISTWRDDIDHKCFRR